MKIRFIRPWSRYAPGQQIDMSSHSQSEWLIDKGFAVSAEPEQHETTALKPPPERAVRRRKATRRKATR